MTAPDEPCVCGTEFGHDCLAVKSAPCGCRYIGHAGLRDVQVLERCERHAKKRNPA